MSALSPEVQKQVIALARNVSLRDVRVVSFRAERVGVPAPGPEAAALSVDSQVAHAPLPPHGFVIEMRFRVEARAREAAGEPFALFEYRVGAIYGLNGELPTAAVLDAFGRTNGMVHLWPYLRAYIQQASAQLSLPALVLPPYRVVESGASAAPSGRVAE
ncbi:hypothetical protein FGE12_20280 [Aggregicoccus sp. 17bor-14]|uniref:hypothetical protein n=1 Tax=Myxococcaceae TaxID=31 RepID=UPI00129CA1FB|nr:MULTISPECIES: hypothetical protein [Myxococcaceae]MBF5044750.1 hypothetical protein [Simulacricoccus sp. 17bor-14]MRI90494.1 hypothetical protein [Aggregicoccus sp. 17bor-14]